MFLLTATGGDSALLATAAFIGVGILGVAVTALVLVLASDRTATEIGDLAARLANRLRRKFGCGPVWWGGRNFERFRRDAVYLLRRRWHVLTLATLAGSLSVFLVLFVSLRPLDVPASDMTLVEAFAAWALICLIGSIPITPSGIGIVELGLTGALVGFGGNSAASWRRCWCFASSPSSRHSFSGWSQELLLRFGRLLRIAVPAMVGPRRCFERIVPPTPLAASARR